MKKCIITITSIVVFTIIATAFIHFGYFEYVLDGANIDRANESYSVVVTLSIGPNALIIKPYDEIVQVKSDKTLTSNKFRVISWADNPFNALPIHRSYDDKIIKGNTRTVSDDEYNTLIEILRNSDFNSIQSEIDNAPLYVDGNSTFISIRDGNDFYSIGGHCAENKDIRFRNIMDHILGLMYEPTA